MKKLFLILLALTLLIGTVPAYAANARYGTQLSSAVQTNTALVLPAGTWVYGVKIFADATSSFMGIYDSATMGNCTDATVKDEIGEATQYDTAIEMWPKPIFFSEGVSVIIATGVGWVIYGPEP